MLGVLLRPPHGHAHLPTHTTHTIHTNTQKKTKNCEACVPNLEDLDNCQFLNPSVLMCWQPKAYIHRWGLCLFFWKACVDYYCPWECHGVLWRSEDTSCFSFSHGFQGWSLDCQGTQQASYTLSYLKSSVLALGQPSSILSERERLRLVSQAEGVYQWLTAPGHSLSNNWGEFSGLITLTFN